MGQLQDSRFVVESILSVAIQCHILLGGLDGVRGDGGHGHLPGRNKVNSGLTNYRLSPSYRRRNDRDTVLLGPITNANQHAIFDVQN